MCVCVCVCVCGYGRRMRRRGDAGGMHGVGAEGSADLSVPSLRAALRIREWIFANIDVDMALYLCLYMHIDVDIYEFTV